MNNHLCACGGSVPDVTLELVAKMFAEKNDPYCTLTVYYGEGADEASANALSAELEKKYPEAEVLVQYGGQPLYYYYIAVQ